MDEEEKEQLQINEPEIGSKQVGEDVGKRTKVTFPKPRKKRSGGKFLLIIIILALIAGFIYFIFSKRESIPSGSEQTPTPSEEQVTSTPTSAPEIDRGEIKIEVLNGTGISGEAAFLQKELGELGYTDIDVGNARNQNYETTEVVFDEGIDSVVKDEILDRLKDLYKDVESSSEDLSGKDVQIFTGLRPGQSFPTDTPTPEATLTLTPTPTSTASATPTP